MSGSLKINLRRFALKASGGYRGRRGADEFARDLLECFGWDDKPPGAEIPAPTFIVAQGKRSTRKFEVFWPERRVLVDVVKRDVMLDFAWKDVLPACLQLDPVPQYVILTNQRELHLYDLARDRESRRLAIAIDQLPKYSEAFPFLRRDWIPGAIPKIINVDRVSKEVADLVAKLYRSLEASHPGGQNDATRFVLQCIVAMFAEDIGLLPQEYFTTVLYEGAASGDADVRLAQLFKEMSTEHIEGRQIPYFNGGLFSGPISLALNAAQLQALTKASESDWNHVDPHIFGSVFQGIMGADERRSSGGHYTDHEDIMRVVGPTIVEPWRERITHASTLAQLQEVLEALSAFRVLDPACGSGNFLYVTFRELYRLETELLSRLHEYSSVRKHDKRRRGKNWRDWGSGIRTRNFHGIDINPFAVELARVTLNLAKKIAFDERVETVAELHGQIEMETDDSLPLDNLNDNIRCQDALFSEWPPVDAIIGNPPFLGAKWMRTELGSDYVNRLKKRYPKVGGDFCVYWFRRAHDHLADGGRAGLVATSGIRSGTGRQAALDYIVDSGGTITNAVSERVWPGDAVVHVSIVNWRKGLANGPHTLLVDDRAYQRDVIHTHLQLHANVRHTTKLKANEEGTSQGVTFGTKAFYVDANTAASLSADTQSRPFVHPVTNGDNLLGGRLLSSPDRAIYMGQFATEREAKEKGGAAYTYLQAHVLPIVREKAEKTTKSSYRSWLQTWWQPWRRREEFFGRIKNKSRIIACSRVASRPIFVFLSTDIIAVDKVQLFDLDDDYSFGILQSSLHWSWVVAKGGRLKGDKAYTTEVWQTFPWPQEVSDSRVSAVSEAGRQLRAVRQRLMREGGWSLRDLYRAAEIEGTHALKTAQDELDGAVMAAYEIPSEQEVTEFLLELNLCLAEDEEAGYPVRGPGLPEGLDPHDPRWFSTDCIEQSRLPEVELSASAKA